MDRNGPSVSYRPHWTTATNLFNGKLFISFDPDFSGFLECLLLDERDLIV